jgi:predicted DNA-binding protein with PD1-like motif
VATCVGSLSRASLRFAGVPGASVREAAFEIVSLVGTLGAGAAPHLHLSLSDAGGALLGGHALEGCVVRTTAEVVLGECEGLVFSRPLDAESGYDELHVAAAAAAASGTDTY